MHDRQTRPPYARAIFIGGAVAAAGILPWVLLARWNARVRADIPWAAGLTLVYLVLLLAWLHGTGWPRATATTRRALLRLWPNDVDPASAKTGRLATAVPFVLGLALLTVVWIVVARPASPPDLTVYPTTAYRWSVFLMGALVSGVVEEAAFRGYMQRSLEPYGAERAVLITSVAFTLVHAVHGLGALLLVGPGIFMASLLYGALAIRTGSIVPGMIVHTLGDLAFTYFGTLRGDASLLFAA